MTEKDETHEAPTFNSYEEFQEWLTSQAKSLEENSESSEDSNPTKKSTSSAKKKPKKKAKKKAAKPDEGKELVEELPVAQENIWCSLHFYTRGGDNVASTRVDAKEEKKFRNDNVLVFYHDHFFGEACTTKCGEVA